MPNSIPARKRLRLLQRDGYRCRYCGAKASDTTLELDHARPKQLGGNSSDENLVTTCDRCNSGKGVYRVLHPDQISELPVTSRLLQCVNEWQDDYLAIIADLRYQISELERQLRRSRGI